MKQWSNLLIDAILRATKLGYKVTFLPMFPEGIAIQLREFEPRGPCSVMWKSSELDRNDGEEMDDETMALAVNTMIDALFELIERLPDVRPNY